MPRIGAGSGVVGVKDLTHNFLTALKCWDLLHSAEPLEKGACVRACMRAHVCLCVKLTHNFLTALRCQVCGVRACVG